VTSDPWGEKNIAIRAFFLCLVPRTSRLYFAYISRSLTLLIFPTLVLGISATMS
jgi:hypothetical protein